MNLYRNILSNAGATALGSAIQLLLLLALARWLPIEQFAVFITATATVGFGEMASDFGVRIWVTRQFAISSIIDGILGLGLLLKAIFSTLLTLVVLLLPFQLLTTQEALLVALVACTQPSTDPLLWYMRGKERLDIEALISLNWRIVNALLIGLAAWSGQSVPLLLSLWLMSNLLRIMVEWQLPVLGALRRAALLGSGNVLGQIIQVVRQSFPIGIAFFVMALYQRLGVLMLGVLAAPETVAHFGAAFTLVASAGFAATSITVATFPKLARAVHEENWQEVSAIANRKLRLVSVVFFPSCLLGMYFAPFIVRIVYPSAYVESAVAMVALLPGLYISSINFALKYLMNTIHKNWMDVVSVLFGIGVFLLAVVSADPSQFLKVVGLAWGLGEASIFITKWAVLKHDARMQSLGLVYHLALFLILVTVMMNIAGGISG